MRTLSASGLTIDAMPGVPTYQGVICPPPSSSLELARGSQRAAYPAVTSSSTNPRKAVVRAVMYWAPWSKVAMPTRVVAMRPPMMRDSSNTST